MPVAPNDKDPLRKMRNTNAKESDRGTAVFPQELPGGPLGEDEGRAWRCDEQALRDKLQNPGACWAWTLSMRGHRSFPFRDSFIEMSFPCHKRTDFRRTVPWLFVYLQRCSAIVVTNFRTFPSPEQEA